MGRNLRLNAVLRSRRSSLLYLLEGNFECILELSARLAPLDTADDPIAVLKGLLVHAMVMLKELVAANGHTCEDVGCLLCLALLY